MELQLRFFATFREAVGSKTLEWDADDDGTVGNVLADLEAEYEGLDGKLLADGGVRPQLNVLVNGRNVLHESGVDTPLSAGDVVSVFPPIAGG